MQSAWLSRRPRPSVAALDLPPGWVPSAVISFLLVICVGNSTVAANWVPDSQLITEVALLGALLMTGLAIVRPIPWPLALAAGLLTAPLAGYLFTSPLLTVAHPTDPHNLGLVSVWAGRISGGEAIVDTPFVLFLLCTVFWIVGGWLTWCVLRWRQPLLGIVPGAAAFATTLLNYPTDQNGFTLAFVVLTIGLLLWNNYVSSVEVAGRARVKLSSDARWDFWETGVVVMATVVALGIFLPPLSRVDTTINIESGAFRGWAELNQRMNHPVAFGRGSSAGTSIGFADEVPLGGPLHRTGGVVMTYTLDGNFAGTRYFRGLDLLQTRNGEWRYDRDSLARLPVPHDSEPPYAETYKAQVSGSFKVQMLKPPEKAPDALFYPGEQLVKVDRDTVAFSSLGAGSQPAGSPDHLFTIDRVSAAGRGGAAGPYKVSILFSRATEAQLRSAGTAYPAWVTPYANFANLYQPPPPSAVPPLAPASQLSGGYRSGAALSRIRQLARQVTADATNPYDQATAIEQYLRTNYTYTLSPPVPPRDVDPIDYFLFTSKQGYCEYYATAMGDMLRSLGVPTRLVNGYGPGTYDDRLARYVVRESDAHTWVEAYYPAYGWIPFEPTSDGQYFPISRGFEGSANCARDSEICDPNAGDINADPTAGAATTDKGALDAGDPTGVGGASGLPFNIPPFVPATFAVLLLLAVAFVAGSRYLRPGTVGGVWRRTVLLTRLAGLTGSVGETPLEFGRRIADEFPETAVAVRELAGDFAVAAYAPPALASARRPSVLSSWEALRPLLVRRVFNRLRLSND